MLEFQGHVDGVRTASTCLKLYTARTVEAYAGKFTDKIEALRTQNTILWDESVDDART